MNLYAELLEQDDKWIVYRFGTSPQNMTGLLRISIEKGLYEIVKYPSELFLMVNVEYLAKKILRLCMSGNIKKRVSREVG